MATLVRLIVLLVLSFGLYHYWPMYSPYLKAMASQPKDFLNPFVENINNVLPDKFQLPVAKEFIEKKYQESPELQKIKEDIQKAATEAAQTEINKLKKTATDQFCDVLIEKIKTECEK